MGLEEQRRTVAKAEKVVFNREEKHLEDLMDLMGRTTKNGIIQEEIDAEITRLKPEGKYDQEEVFVGANIYTSGRKDRAKPRLNQIKSEKWAKDGE